MADQLTYIGGIPLKAHFEHDPRVLRSSEERQKYSAAFERELNSRYRREFSREEFFDKLRPEHREDLEALLDEIKFFGTAIAADFIVVGFGSVLYHDAETWPPARYHDVDLRVVPASQKDLDAVTSQVPQLTEALSRDRFKCERTFAKSNSPFTPFCDFLYDLDVLHLTSCRTSQLYDLNLPVTDDLVESHLAKEKEFGRPFAILLK